MIPWCVAKKHIKICEMLFIWEGGRDCMSVRTSMHKMWRRLNNDTIKTGKYMLNTPWPKYMDAPFCIFLCAFCLFIDLVPLNGNILDNSVLQILCLQFGGIPFPVWSWYVHKEMVWGVWCERNCLSCTFGWSLNGNYKLYRPTSVLDISNAAPRARIL